MAVVLTDLFAVHSLDGSVFFRVDSSGDLLGASGSIGSTSAEGGSIYLADSKVLAFGADQDDSFTHNGTNSVWTHSTGDLTFDNTLVTGSTNMQLGTDTSATDFGVLNNTGTSLFTVDGAGSITLGGATTIGDDLKLSFGVTGTDATIEWVSASDDLLLDVANAVGIGRLKTGTDTSATKWQIEDNGGTVHFSVDGAGDTVMGATTGATHTLAGKTVYAGSAGSTGLVTYQEGNTATEGWQRVIYEGTISPAAIETAILTVPAGSIVDGVWAQCSAALTGGSTTVTWSIGITGDVDSYGTATNDTFTTQADSLAQDIKWTYLAGVTPLSNAGASIGLFNASAVAMKLIGAAAGGAAAGDTALTVGSVRIRVAYRTALPMDNE